MDAVVGVALLLVFLALSGLMVTGRLPALLALPLMALAMGVVAGYPYFLAKAPPEVGPHWFALTSTVDHLFQTIVKQGVPRLAGAIFPVMLGGVFGKLLEGSGVAKSVVRRVAELAGDRVFGLAVALTLTVAFLFTSLGGLGAVIMVASIVFPVLLSVGVPPLTTGCIFLMGFSMGGVFNLVNWALYTKVLGMSTEAVARFAVPFGLVYLVVVLVFLVVELRRARLAVPGASVAKAAGAVAALVAAGYAVVRHGGASLGLGAALRTPFVVAVLLLCLVPRRGREPGLPAMLAPLVPLGLVMFLGWDVTAAFVAGVLYLLLKAPGEDRDRQLSKAFIEGVEGVTPAVCLMMGIGMLLVAAFHESVSQVVAPAVTALVPGSPLGFVAFFGVLAPLALYRGPLNIWGMGFGLAGILHQAAVLSPPRIMVAFLSAGQIQGVCDPTNTHNVWIAGQLRVDLNDILKLTLPYIWTLAVLGLVLGTYVV